MKKIRKCQHVFLLKKKVSTCVMCSVAPYRLSATNTRQHSSTRFFLVLSITSALSIRSPEIYPQKKKKSGDFSCFQRNEDHNTKDAETSRKKAP